MKIKTIGLLVFLGLVSLLFTACNRSASVSPTSVPTATQSEIPFPVATQPQIMADILKQTQTAMALSTESSSFPSAATSTPAFTFNTPEAASTEGVGGGILVSSTPMALATAAPTKIAYAMPTPGRPATYTIQAGEYLWCLARRFDVNVADLLNLNGMNSNSMPGIGTVIKIPSSGSFGAARARYAHPATYTVRAGDTMGGIACYYGDADPNTIYAANGLTPGSAISVGQVLQIP